jgi:hypothetical protein
MIKFDNIEQLKDLEDTTLIQLWNDYCQENNMYDDTIYENDEDFLNTFTPLEVAQRVSYGEYQYRDMYVKFNGYGNFVSFTYTSDVYSHIDFDELLKWLKEIQ